MTPTEIDKYVNAIERFFKELILDYKRKLWVKIFLRIGLVFIVLLNPSTISYGLGFLNIAKPEWYSYPWWLVITAPFFLIPIVILRFTKEKEVSDHSSPVSIIKFLSSYTNRKEDVEWFLNFSVEKSCRIV